MIDEESSKLVRSADTIALEMAEKHRGTVERLAGRLLNDETVNDDVLVGRGHGPAPLPPADL